MKVRFELNGLISSLIVHSAEELGLTVCVGLPGELAYVAYEDLDNEQWRCVRRLKTNETPETVHHGMVFVQINSRAKRMKLIVPMSDWGWKGPCHCESSMITSHQEM